MLGMTCFSLAKLEFNQKSRCGLIYNNANSSTRLAKLLLFPSCYKSINLYFLDERRSRSSSGEEKELRLSSYPLIFLVFRAFDQFRI